MVARRNIAALCAALAALLILASGLPAMAASLVLTGEVTYRERIALPPQSRLKLTLLDVSGADSQTLVEAMAPLSGSGQVPLQFTFEINTNAIDPHRDYALVAEITSSGSLWFKNPIPLSLDPFHPPEPLLVMVNFVGVDARPNAAPPLVADLEVTTALLDTVWTVESMAESAAVFVSPITLTIAPDRRAGGVGGCNDYFAEAHLEGPDLSFGPIVASRKLCAASVMTGEAAYFEALSDVTAYELEDDHLLLLDRYGITVIRLVKAR
jgi:putative lipoprotein